MPYQTVSEVVTRRVLSCRQCGRLIQPAADRGNYATGGSIAGSVGGSVVGSVVGDMVLGPVGMLAGMVGGAVAGSSAGAAAGDGLCDAVESCSEDLCEGCRRLDGNRRTAARRWVSADGDLQATGRADGAGKRKSRWNTRTGQAAAAVGDCVNSTVSWIWSDPPAANSSASEQGGRVLGGQPQQPLQLAIAQSLKEEQGRFEAELEELEQMGFVDRDRNLALLLAHRGAVDVVVAELLKSA